MGVCEEMGGPEFKGMMGKEKTDHPVFLLNNPLTFFQRSKAEPRQRVQTVLIVSLILVIIVLSVNLIIVWTRSRSRDLNNEVCAHSAITTAPEIVEIIFQKSAPCEDDWIWHRGKCYYFSTEPDTWRNSEKFCHSHNSSLAIIDDKEELDFLFRFKDTYNHWIGLRRTDDNTAWIWTNGSLYNESLFKIRRSSPENTEFVYLNSRDVGSQGGNYDFRWICSKK